MSIWTRRARLRSLTEGLVQKARAESLENQAHDDAERFQDYGFAANPIDGQGLVMHVGGHTIVLRMDRLAERPRLAAHEVCVWHREGHCITLKADGVIEIKGASLRVDVTGDIAFKGGALSFDMAGGTRIAGGALSHNGVNIGSDHVHGEVEPGPGTTGVPR